MIETKEKELLKDYELIEAHKKGDSEALDLLLTRYKIIYLIYHIVSCIIMKMLWI